MRPRLAAIDSGSVDSPSRAPRVLLALALALGAPAVTRAERLPIRTFQATDGLAGDAVRALFRDSRGYLWIATSSGVSRFDGEAFRNYAVAEGLPGPRVRDVAETPDGTIWFATSDGLARLAPDAERTLRPIVVESLPLPVQTVSRLLADADGRLWVGTRGLLRLDPSAEGAARFERIALPTGDADVGDLAFDRRGGLWIATNAGALLRRPDGTARLFATGGPTTGASFVVVDTADRLWTGGPGGLFVADAGALLAAEGDRRPLADRARTPRFAGELPGPSGEVLFYDARHGLPDDHLYAATLAGAARDGVWVATRGGATEIRGGRLRTIGVAQGLAEAPLVAALEDVAGTLWLGGESRGLARLRPTGFVAYDTLDGLADDRAVTLFDGPDGALYAITTSRELHRFDGARFERITPRSLFDGRGSGWGWNQFALFDRRGALWFPANGLLARFAPVADPRRLAGARPERRWTVADGLPGDDLFRLFEDRRGDVWVSVIASPPLVRLEQGERVVPVPQVVGGTKTGGAPTAFVETRAGSLWIGFYVGGVARVREGSWTFFREPEGVPPGFVADLRVDRAGRLWIATTSGGVARVDDPEAEVPEFRRYTTAEGLSTDNARCVVDDAEGRIYVGTARGVDRLDPESGRIRSYTTEEGLPNSQVWACHAEPDGSLWFGTLHGLARYDPARDRPPVAPEIRITAIRVGGQEVPVAELGARAVDGLEIAPDRNALQIDFAGVGLEAGERPLFQYRLGDPSGEWSEPTPARSVTYSHLGPGAYRFEVRALTQEGRGGATVASVGLRVVPPFWQRPLFLLAVALLLALVAWLFERTRVARLVAVERARTAIAADLHDDVGASVSRIGMLGELARHRLRESPTDADAMLSAIGEQARELAEVTSDIVWAIDPRRDDLGSLAVRLRRFAADLLEARGVALDFSAPPDAERLRLAPEVRRALYLCLKEAIHNAARHSGAARVRVEIVRYGETFLGRVEDDGRGIPAGRAEEAASEGRHGLAGLPARAAGVGGRALVTSEPGRGTRVEIALPLVPAAHHSAPRPSHRRASPGPDGS